MKTIVRKVVKISPPFDKRHTDPKKNYGIGAMRIWFGLKGKHGAVTVQFSTQYYPVPIMKEHLQKGDFLKLLDIGSFGGRDHHTFQCWDVGFHSLKKPKYMKRKNKMLECEFTGKHCYYDGSSLRGIDLKLGEQFYEKGEDVIWEFLQGEYKRVFDVEEVVIRE